MRPIEGPIFALNGSDQFGKQVALHLDLPLSPHTERRFEDGEIYVKSDENVRGCDVYVIHSLYSDEKISAGEKLATLLFFLGSLSDASAGRITVVAPYLAYSRQDRKTESRAPITTKYIAKLLEISGADRLLTMDVHNLSSFQNAFRIPTDNLEARNLFVDMLIGKDSPDGCVTRGLLSQGDIDELVFLSPDSGGMSRTKLARDAMSKRLGDRNNISIAYMDKRRTSGTEVEGTHIIGDVNGKKVIVLDDMIATGKTIFTTQKAIEQHGGDADQHSADRTS
jgi:ribose-phosphate pyrophosphokinase